MASFLTCLFLIATVQVFRSDAQCPSAVNLQDTDPKYTSSPNYPQHYPRNESCELTITARSILGQVVHVSSIEMHLDGDKDHCNDKIEFMNTDNTVIYTACGREMFTLQSPNQVLKIKFTSDDRRESKGYYLKYWSAPSYSDACSNNMIQVGTNPIFLKLPHTDGIIAQNCSYKLMAPTANDMIIVDIPDWDEPEALACGHGDIMVQDGTGTTMVKTCGSERPFWSVGSQGQNLTIGLNFTGRQNNTKTFKVRAMSMSKTPANCNEVSNMRIGPISSYLWYPVFTASGQLCPKTLLAPRTTVRATVKEKTCTSDLPFSASNGIAGPEIPKRCEGDKPMFISESQDLKLQAGSGTPVLLEVASFASYCNPNSSPMEFVAVNKTMEQIMMEDIQRNSYCMRRIKATNTDEVVNIILESNLEGDECVYAYDGMDDNAALLGSMCGEFEKKLISSGQYLTFKVVTNGNAKAGKLEVKYFSARKEGSCPDEINLLATRTKKELTSPNYPMEYPIDSMCLWRFVSYRPDFVVVIEVKESDLPEDCSARGYVNDGEKHESENLGEWCGVRKRTFRGSGQTLLVTFDANNMKMMGKKGFKFVYYADNKVARELVGGTDVLTIAGVLTIIVVACGLIFIAYRLCTAKRAKRRAKKEDLQPITQ